jgi:hypothetical protein
MVVPEALVLRNIADGAQGGPANFARTFCKVVDHRENLIGVLIKQQVVVAEMRSRHVPMKILRFKI